MMMKLFAARVAGVIPLRLRLRRQSSDPRLGKTSTARLYSNEPKLWFLASG